MQVASLTRAHTRLANNLAWTYLSISLFNNTHSEIAENIQNGLVASTVLIENKKKKRLYVARIAKKKKKKLPGGSMYLSHEHRGMTHEGVGTHFTIR